MSWIRASRKLVDPEGVAWDVYVTRARQARGRGTIGRLRALAPRGITRRVEAVSDWPRPRRIAWEIEGPVGRVMLDEIARGLALGKVPHPAGATCLGEQEV
jgi:hypothetical protein